MKHLLLCLLSAFGLCAPCAAATKVPPLDPADFIAAYRADTAAVLLDVRRPDEFAAGHLAGARNIDFLDNAAFSAALASLDKTHTYYIYCRSGRRSQQAALRMQAAGFRVRDMDGGILLWRERGLPEERGGGTGK